MHLENHLTALTNNKLSQLFSSNKGKAKQIQQDLEEIKQQSEECFESELNKLKQMDKDVQDFLQESIQQLIAELIECKSFTQEQIIEIQDCLNQALQNIQRIIDQEQNNIQGLKQSPFLNLATVTASTFASLLVQFFYGAAAGFITGLVFATGSMAYSDKEYRGKIFGLIQQLKEKRREFEDKHQKAQYLKIEKELQSETEKVLSKLGSGFLETKEQNQLKECVAWLDYNISSRENQMYCNKIKKKFPNMMYCFTKNQDEFLCHLKKNSHVSYVIISGSCGKQTIKELLLISSIKSIIVFCVDVETHSKWAMNYLIVFKVVNQFPEVILTLGDLLNQHIYVGACSLRQLPNHLKNHCQYYLGQSFSGNVPGNITADSELLIKNTLKQYSNRIKEQQFKFLKQQHDTQQLLAQKIQEILCKNKQEQQFIDAIIRLYTQEGPFYKMLNAVLNTLNEKAIEEYSLIIKAMRYALFNFKDGMNKKIKSSDFRLYRGINFDPNRFKVLNRKNDAFVFPAFTSTTTKKEIAKKFGKLIIEIKFDISQQQLGEHFDLLRPKDISQISYYRGEAEFLFPCFSPFVILDFEEEGEYTIVKTKFLDFSRTE